MIYVDSSVLLADLLAEARSPPALLWEEDLSSSRLLAYEVWNRISAHGLTLPLGGRTNGLLARVSLTEMSERVLARALEPFPVSVRTLDALHLATIEFLRSEGAPVQLASYDARLVTAARALGVPIAPV